MSIELILGDCLEKMAGIPDGSVDAILCDLPYSVTRNTWDCPIPLDRLWAEYLRVTKPNGAIVLTADEPFTSHLICSNLPMFRYRWTWDKCNPTGFLNAKIQPLRVTEDICVFYRRPPTYNPQKESRGKERRKGGYNKPGGSDNYGTFGDRQSFNNEYYPTNLLSVSNANRAEKVHPTQKPVALCSYLIKTYTDPGETVLDNCAGSFSTGVACVNTGRSFIGIERDETYFNIGRQRLADAQAQPALLPSP